MRRLIFILVVLLIFSEGNVFAGGFLKASGRTIINSSTGREVFLKGIGLGNWVVQEGYMMQTSSFANAQRDIRTKIQSLLGTALTDSFYNVYWKNYVTRKDINKLAEWGFNSVRLPMHYNQLCSVDYPGYYFEEGFRRIDSLLAWCEANSIYLILDLHAAPGAQSPDNISDSDGQARLWTEPDKYQPITVNLWKEIARRYANKEWIGGYDLINETHYSLGSSNTALWTLFKNITAAIREVDKNHMIILEGNDYGNNYNGLSLPADDNLVISFHKYWNETSLGTIQGFINLRNSLNRPLWLGETGENSNQWIAECMTLLKANNIGWSLWPHKKFASTAGMISAIIPPDYQTLLNYWKNTALPKPSQTFAFNAMMQMAENTLLEKCDLHIDYVDAAIRQPETSETLPFAENKLPGRIYAVNYDLGKVGYAYQDKDYKNSSGNAGGVTYNSGWQYRNDGVDIEKCSDNAANTNGYNVGWINPGEWLQYTVDAARTGYYKASLRTAAANSDGRLIIYIDGKSVTNYIDIPNSGGNQSWKTTVIDSIEIPAGKHEMQVFFSNGGFNLNYIEFAGIGFTGNDTEGGPKGYFLGQNYPNPFNPVSKIKYSIEQEGNVSLKIYNSLGKEAAVLINERQAAGSHTVEINASKLGLTSGAYFYTLTSGSFTDSRKFIILK